MKPASLFVAVALSTAPTQLQAAQSRTESSVSPIVGDLVPARESKDAERLTRLARRAQQGDREAFDLLVRESASYVRAVCRRLAADTADADELAQETMYSALRNLDRFEGRCRFETWLFALARSQASHRYRRQRPVPMSSLLHEPEPGDHGGFESTAVAGTDLQDALRLLPDVDREILLGRDLEGLSSEEVADRLSMSVGAVKSRLHRARTWLRERLS